MGSSGRLAALVCGALVVVPTSGWAAGPVTGEELAELPELSGSWSSSGSQEVASGPWWSEFGDSHLDELIRRGVHGNPDLAAARGVVDISRASANQARAGLLPTVVASASITEAPMSSLSSSMGSAGLDEDDSFRQGSVGVSASMGVDIFGRTTTSWRAGVHEAEASGGDLAAASLNLTANIARSYFDVVAGRELLSLYQQQVEANEQILRLTELRYGTSGDATGLDLLQQRQQTAAARSRLPQAEMSLSLASQRLGVLIGAGPLAVDLGVATELPSLAETPNLGTPAELLERRPDLRAAASRLDGAHLRKISAMLALAPSISAQGSWGQQFLDLGLDDDSDIWSDTWSVGLSASIPLFTGGAALSGLQAARASELIAARSAESAILRAMQEVEGALEQERSLNALLDASRAQLEAAEAAFDNASERYGQGLITYQQVLPSLTSLQSAQLSELTTRRDLLDARISLHTALGGSGVAGLDAPNGADR